MTRTDDPTTPPEPRVLYATQYASTANTAGETLTGRLGASRTPPEPVEARDLTARPLTMEVYTAALAAARVAFTAVEDEDMWEFVAALQGRGLTVAALRADTARVPRPAVLFTGDVPDGVIEIGSNGEYTLTERLGPDEYGVAILLARFADTARVPEGLLRDAVVAYLDHMDKREPYAGIHADIVQAGAGGPDFTGDRHFDGDGCFAAMERAALATSPERSEDETE